MLGANELTSDLGMEGFGPRPAKHESATVDMTAMIDLVFMMNIFFLVTSLVTAMAELDLPSANHVVPVDPEKSVIVLVQQTTPGQAQVSLQDDGTIFSGAKQDEQISAAVESRLRAGKSNVLIKGERNLTVGQVVKPVGPAASAVEGTRLYWAVMEKDE